MSKARYALRVGTRRFMFGAVGLTLMGLAQHRFVLANQPEASKQTMIDLDIASELLMMRHADAPGYSDPANMTLNDCKTQRNLGSLGREQAQRVGETLRQRGVKTATVWTSPWCRCVDTASLLGFDAPIIKDFLGSFFVQRDRSVGQTEALEAAVASWFARKPTTALLLVTHQVNIAAYSGQSTSSGEMLRIKTRKNGKPESYRRAID